MSAIRVESFLTADVSSALLAELSELCVRAFDGDFDPEDWDHALGGRHFVSYAGDRPIAHASVVPRVLDVDGRSFRTGYVEAVATEPDFQSRGFGALAMSEATYWIPGEHEMGGLATGEFGFYERLGWERWTGPTFVRDGAVTRRSEDADGAIMVFRFGPSAAVDLAGSISCETRPGDDW